MKLIHRIIAATLAVMSLASIAHSQDLMGFDRASYSHDTVVLSQPQSAGLKVQLEAAVGTYNNEPIRNYGSDSVFARIGRSVGRLDVVTDTGFAYWHSATFNNDGTKIVFTDEWGGGGRARCRAWDPLDWGADAIYDIVDNKLEFRSHYKMPAPQVETENCVAHNGSIIPVQDKDIFVQAWYQGGISVMDFTDSSNPKEIAYFDRGPIDKDILITGGYWSAYYYDGYIYGTEITRGLDVFRLVPSEFLSQKEIDQASNAYPLQGPMVFNPQQQIPMIWPESISGR